MRFFRAVRPSEYWEANDSSCERNRPDFGKTKADQLLYIWVSARLATCWGSKRKLKMTVPSCEKA